MNYELFIAGCVVFLYLLCLFHALDYPSNSEKKIKSVFGYLKELRDYDIPEDED